MSIRIFDLLKDRFLTFFCPTSHPHASRLFHLENFSKLGCKKLTSGAFIAFSLRIFSKMFLWGFPLSPIYSSESVRM